MSKQINLHRRNGRYYIRVRVPKDLIATLNKKEIKYSLKTADRAEALERFHLKMIEIQQLFANKRQEASSPTPPSPDKPSLTPIQIERAILLWHEHETSKIDRELDEFRLTADEFEMEEVRQSIRDDLAALESGNERQYGRVVHLSVKEAFSAAGLEAPSTTDNRNHAYSLAHQGLIEQAHQRLKLCGESYNRQPFSFFLNRSFSNTALLKTEGSQLTLSALFDKFRKARKSDGMTEKTLNGYKLTFDFATELWGEGRNITSITSEDCRGFRNELSKLPSNAKKRYPHLSLLDAAKAHTDDSTTLSSTSINGNLNKLSAIFNFAVQEGFIEKSPASHIKPVQDSKKVANDRTPFSIEELNNIFKAPLYSGCENDERGYSKAGESKPKRHRFWVPLISLYTGMRLNEICQLHSEDIQEESGVHYIQVEASAGTDKTLKTRQSERRIPIHKELIRIGFIDYAKQVQAAGHERLFPAIIPSASGSYSATFTKWYRNFLISRNLKRKGLCFHSFRHTFRDAMREAGINREIAAQLGGWKISESVMDEYGSGHRIESLNDAMQNIQYPLLELEHLYID